MKNIWGKIQMKQRKALIDLSRWRNIGLHLLSIYHQETHRKVVWQNLGVLKIYLLIKSCQLLLLLMSHLKERKSHPKGWSWNNSLNLISTSMVSCKSLRLFLNTSKLRNKISYFKVKKKDQAVSIKKRAIACLKFLKRQYFNIRYLS